MIALFLVSGFHACVLMEFICFLVTAVVILVSGLCLNELILWFS